MQGKIARQRIVLNRQLDIIYDLVTELEECGIRQDSSLLEEIERETTECWN